MYSDLSVPFRMPCTFARKRTRNVCTFASATYATWMVFGRVGDATISHRCAHMGGVFLYDFKGNLEEEDLHRQLVCGDDSIMAPRGSGERRGWNRYFVRRQIALQGGGLLRKNSRVTSFFFSASSHQHCTKQSLYLSRERERDNQSHNEHRSYEMLIKNGTWMSFSP